MAYSRNRVPVVLYILWRGQKGMYNREERRGLSETSEAGVMREHASPCVTGRPVINEPAPQ
jgi:hypothetical protein